MTEAIEQRVTRTEEQIRTLFNCAERTKDRLEKHEEEDGKAMGKIMDRLDKMQDAYANRLPIWAVCLIAALTSAIGWLASKVI